MRGGRREGAGRPVGTGKYGEPTRFIRVPLSLLEHVQQMIADLLEKRLAGVTRLEYGADNEKDKNDDMA